MAADVFLNQISAPSGTDIVHGDQRRDRPTRLDLRLSGRGGGFRPPSSSASAPTRYHLRGGLADEIGQAAPHCSDVLSFSAIIGRPCMHAIASLPPVAYTTVGYTVCVRVCSIREARGGRDTNDRRGVADKRKSFF